MIRALVALLSLVALASASDSAGVAHLDKNAARSDVVVRPSGLQYEVLASGDPAGEHPSDDASLA